MYKHKKKIFYIVSDSLGQSAMNMIRASLSKFQNMNYIIKDYTFISTSAEIKNMITNLKAEESPLVFNALTNHKISELLKENLIRNNIRFQDILDPITHSISNFTGLELTKQEINSKQDLKLDDRYFNRIDALEFAVQHDDGKEPKGFLEAEIVILGISRTSKTPLSIYLANNNYKVANLPLLPESKLPPEIFKVDKRRIFGLTNDIKVLSEIRKERMISYGLNSKNNYSNKKRIKKEIDYTLDLYNKIDCKVINVSNKSIEETAALIIGHLNKSGLIGVVEES